MEWFSPVTISIAAAALVLLAVVIPSIRFIGADEFGLPSKRFALKDLAGDNPIALEGEAGFQAELLMPGWHFRNWFQYTVQKFPWVQVAADEVGIVIAQVGKGLPAGFKTGAYKPAFGQYTDVAKFIREGGEKGGQRIPLPPGTSLPIHPVGFLVVTSSRVYGLPISPELQKLAGRGGVLTPQSLGLDPKDLKQVRIPADEVGIVTAIEGPPLDSGDIACRLGGFGDLEALMQDANKTDGDLIEILLGNQNKRHNNYQDYQAFLDAGGRMGIQHDVLMPGAYVLNPLVVKVQTAPMLVVNQGEVAVVKAFVGLMTQDVSGDGYKHGSLVRPGRRGIWEEPLRTGKYALNTRCYQPELVPTAILTLNWAEATSKAHNLDANLTQIDAKSREGFEFRIDLQVQIHVPDKKASRVISMVGSMDNLVNEVLQAAVGNHFRDKLQGLPAIKFVETRQDIQLQARTHIEEELAKYNVETRGVYIQDVVQPKALIDILTERELANQRIATFEKERESEEKRIAMEQAKGKADMQAKLAQSTVQVEIETNNAKALKAKADGEAGYITAVGQAEASKTEAIGRANAAGYQAQKDAIGAQATAIVNVVQAIAEGKVNIMPEVLVMGGGGGAMEALASVVTQAVRTGSLPGAGKVPPVASAKDGDNGSRKLKVGAGDSVEVEVG